MVVYGRNSFIPPDKVPKALFVILIVHKINKVYFLIFETLQNRLTITSRNIIGFVAEFLPSCPSPAKTIGAIGVINDNDIFQEIILIALIDLIILINV